MKKFFFRYFPFLLMVVALIWTLLLRKTNESLAYIGCAAFLAVAMILMCLDSRSVNQAEAEKQHETLERLQRGERLAIVLRVMRVRKLGNEKPNKKVFSLDVFPAGTDLELLRRFSSISASNRDYAECDRITYGSVDMTEAELQKLSGMTFVVFEPDYQALGRVRSYLKFLQNNTFIFDSEQTL